MWSKLFAIIERLFFIIEFLVLLMQLIKIIINFVISISKDVPKLMSVFANYKGILPCFFGGFAWFLFLDISSA